MHTCAPNICTLITTCRIGVFLFFRFSIFDFFCVSRAFYCDKVLCCPVCRGPGGGRKCERISPPDVYHNSFEVRVVEVYLLSGTFLDFRTPPSLCTRGGYRLIVVLVPGHKYPKIGGDHLYGLRRAQMFCHIFL